MAILEKLRENNFTTKDRTTLYVDNEGVETLRKNMLSSVEKLVLDTSAFDMEDEINGTECVQELINQWHKVAETTDNYRNFYIDHVNPAIIRTIKSVNDTAQEIADALDGDEPKAITCSKNVVKTSTKNAAAPTQKAGKTTVNKIDEKYAQYMTGDEAVDAEIKNLFKVYGDDLSGLDSRSGLYWNRFSENQKKALARIYDVSTEYVEGHLSTEKGKKYLTQLENILRLTLTSPEDSYTKYLFNGDCLAELCKYSSSEQGKQYTKELKNIEMDKVCYGASFEQNISIKLDGVGIVFSLSYQDKKNGKEILCHTDEKRTKKCMEYWDRVYPNCYEKALQTMTLDEIVKMYNNAKTSDELKKVDYTLRKEYYYNKYYNQLNEQMEYLTDDDSKNDAEAIKKINNTLKHFVNIETENGNKKLVYDTELIDYCITNSEQDSLLHNIMTNFKANIPESGIATELNGSIAPEYSLKMSQLMAGYQLTISADSKLFGSELKNEQVAYAATEKTAENYFYDGDKLNWDNIQAWFDGESVPAASIEYDVMAYAVEGMSDAEVSELLNKGEKAIDIFGYGYNQSDKLGILADRCVLQAEIKKRMGIENTDNYTRAVLIKNITECMYTSGGGKNHIITISSDEDYNGHKIYSAEVAVSNTTSQIGDVIANDMQGRNIVVYAPGNSSADEGYLDELVGQTISNLAPSVSGEAADFIIDQSASFICGKIGDPASGMYAFGTELVKLKEAYEKSVESEGAKEMLAYGNAVECMYISGSVVHISGSSVNSAYVYSLQYDEIKLCIAVEAYNREKGTNYTSEEMKNAFYDQKKLFDDYRAWYKNGGDDKVLDVVDEVEGAFGYKLKDVLNMDLKELEAYFNEKN